METITLENKSQRMSGKMSTDVNGCKWEIVIAANDMW